jgi:hypothetical protein
MRGAIIAVALVCATPTAVADPPTAELVDPTGSAGTSAGASSDLWSTLILEASTESKKAKARIGWSSSDWIGELAVSMPIDEDAEEAELASLDGLAKGSTLEAGLGYLQWDPSADAQAQTVVCAEYALAIYTCDEKLPEDVKKSITDAQAEVCKQFGVDPCKRDGFTVELGKIAFDEAKAAVCRKDRAELEADPKKAMERVTCSSGGLANEKHPEFRRRFDRAVDYGKAALLGVRAKLGKPTFKFADPMTYAKQTTDETTFSLLATAGTILDDVVYVSLGYEYQRSFKQGTSAERCRPLDMAGNLECLDLPLGAPALRKRHLIRGELRRFLSPRAAVVLRVAYDFTDEVLGFEIPIYFLQRKDEGLAGGVTLGFRDDEDEPTVVFFISETLQFAELP